MKPRRLGLWFALLTVAGLVSRWSAPRARAGRCALDGNRIVEAYRVDLLAGETVEASFCSVLCATDWPELPADVARTSWRVRDEITGEALDSSRALFVESSVVTVPSRRARTHVFSRWSDAMEHIAQYGGEQRPNPFAR